VGIINLDRNNTMSQEIYNKDLTPLAPLYRIQTDFLTMGTKMNGGNVIQNQSDVNDLSTKICTELSQYSSAVTDPKEKTALSQMSADISQYIVVAKDVLSNFQINNEKAAYEGISGKMSTISAHFDGLITDLYTQKITAIYAYHKNKWISSSMELFIKLIKELI
jgi:methyl-accepting chemotaxis protein